MVGLYFDIYFNRHTMIVHVHFSPSSLQLPRNQPDRHMVRGGDGRWATVTDILPALCKPHVTAIPSAGAEKHRSCLGSPRAAKHCSQFPSSWTGLNPNPLAKCKSGIRTHVKTAYSQAACSKRPGPIHGVIQSDSTLSLLLSDNPVDSEWGGLLLGECSGTRCRFLFMLAAVTLFPETRSFPFREKVSTSCWELFFLYVHGDSRVLTRLWLRSHSG